MKNVNLLLLLFVGMIYLQCKSQTPNELFSDITDSSCECINKLDNSNMSNIQISSCIEKSYSTHQSQISTEMMKYMDKNNVTEEITATHFQKQIVSLLIDNCPLFYSNTVKVAEDQSNLTSSTPSNNIVEKSARKICDCIDKLNSLTQSGINICIDKSTNYSNV